MELGLRGKSALVTASSYGLGRACAESLAAEGVSLTLTARNPDKLNQTAEELSAAHGVHVDTHVGDLQQSESLDALIQSVQARPKAYDILVVSSGHPATLPASQASDADWQDGIDLLMRPVIRLCRALVPEMKEQGFGRVILIGSIFGLRPEVSSVVQSTLRSGIISYTRCLAQEYAAFGVTANVICPGYFKTPLVDSLAQQYARQDDCSLEEVLSQWEAYPPSKRFGSPEELGSLVAFLASTQAALINGSSIAINA